MVGRLLVLFAMVGMLGGCASGNQGQRSDGQQRARPPLAASGTAVRMQASAQAAEDASPKCRKAARRFRKGLEVQRRLAAISVERESTAGMGKKYRSALQMAQRSQKHFESAIALKCIPWVTAALFHIGLQYAQVAEMVLESPVPDRLSDSQKETYCTELFGNAEQVYAKAIEAWYRTIQFSQNVGVRNRWVRRARGYLSAGKLDKEGEVAACVGRSSGSVAQKE